MAKTDILCSEAFPDDEHRKVKGACGASKTGLDLRSFFTGASRQPHIHGLEESVRKGGDREQESCDSLHGSLNKRYKQFVPDPIERYRLSAGIRLVGWKYTTGRDRGEG